MASALAALALVGWARRAGAACPWNAEQDGPVEDKIIFGTGLPKAGTRSLGAALRTMGITAAKSMPGRNAVGIVYKVHRDLLPLAWAGSANASAAGSENPLLRLRDVRSWEGPTFFSDFPFYGLPCELQAAYPDAVFIHVQRGCAGWARSALRQLFCVWLSNGCAAFQQRRICRDDRVENHMSVGFCTTLWYFNNLDRGLLGKLFCRNRKEVCVTVTNERTFNESVPATAAILERLERLCHAHTALVGKCVPPERLLTLQLRSDGAEVARIAPFLGCDDEGDGDRLVAAWARIGLKGAANPVARVGAPR